MAEAPIADLEVQVDHDLAVGVSRPEPASSRRIPRAQGGQLQLLRQQLDWCTRAIELQQRNTASSMRDGELGDAARWEAVRALRALAWKVCLEVLPLVGRVPRALQSHPAFVEVQRSAHVLRRATEDALRDNDNYTADLVAASMEADRVRA